MTLRRPVVAWLVWLVAAHSVMAAAAWSSPAPWKIGAYERAIAIASPHWWSVAWLLVVVAAVSAIATASVRVARTALVASIVVQLPWAASVVWQGVAQGEPWAYLPAMLVWLSPAAGSASQLLGPLTQPQWHPHQE